ncbi:HD family phosphohydrolase [Vulgatibacter incomptus]|uniref:Membrane protein containing HD superfamily hydrolase n=1 Tax=Vulgatibacter incomptus TaxID=1391653 RepID=A0A0K1PAR8_9BACT|nr:HDIG domain-containing metalloprotein [Vulgatibacter incomptus]AKU90597.1 Membrane protein containing HD superfamily hydrolase [Vulgatibacter incomptus]
MARTKDKAALPTEPKRVSLSGVVDRLLGLVLLALVAAAAATALNPGLLDPRIPYDDRDLGSFATATIKANRAYDLPDEETTRRMREEAVAAVRAVYEYDALAVDAIVARIHSGFDFARSLSREAETEGASSPHKVETPKGDASKEAPSYRAIERERGEIERRLGARLEEEELAALTRAGFPEAVEEGVVTLVTQVMREMVVGDREELAQHRSRGIAIRRLGPKSVVTEEFLSEVGGIRDLSAVRERIEGNVESLSRLPRELRLAAVNLARREIRTNLKYDGELTRKRREDAGAAVKPVAIQLKKGEKIIGDGERIEARHLAIFRGMRAQSQETDLVQARIGGALLAALLALGLFGFARSGKGFLRLSRKDRVLLALLLSGMLVFSRFAITLGELLRERVPTIPVEAWTWVVPFAAGAMALRFVLGAAPALLFSVAFAALAGVMAGNSLAVGVFVLLGSLAGAARVAGARDRGGIFKAGAAAGLAQAASVICFALFAGQLLSWELVVSVLTAFVGGAVFTPILVTALIALFESVFGYTTDLRLLELANLNHSALKELIVQAPGTYHHSIIVGTLVEGAAEAIGANPLLAKVCAYYHDLGKGKNPLYFGENQRGGNRHDDLPPEESARLIIEHVATGLELARKHKLPRVVADAIPQHHGTRLVGYFYHKALREQEGREAPEPVDPTLYRYAGPKPQSPETALVMMADAAEAASRSLADPSEEKLRQLVNKLIAGISADGQLDECGLTLRDLSRIGASFCATLQGIYHSRPEYPAGAHDAAAKASLAASHPPDAEAPPTNVRALRK